MSTAMLMVMAAAANSVKNNMWKVIRVSFPTVQAARLNELYLLETPTSPAYPAYSFAASASSEDPGSGAGAFVAANVSDGVPAWDPQGNYWQSQSLVVGSQWVQLAYPSLLKIEAVKFNVPAGYGGFMLPMVIQGSTDGTNFTDLLTINKTAAEWGAQTDHVFAI